MNGKRKNYRKYLKCILLLGVFVFGCGFSYTTYARYITISDTLYDEITIYFSESSYKYLVNDNGKIVNELSTVTVTGVTEINGNEYNAYFPFANDSYININDNETIATHYLNNYELISTNIDFNGNVPTINFNTVTICLLGGVFVCLFYLAVKQ